MLRLRRYASQPRAAATTAPTRPCHGPSKTAGNPTAAATGTVRAPATRTPTMATAPAAADALRLPNRFDSGMGNAPITDVTLPTPSHTASTASADRIAVDRCENSPAINRHEHGHESHRRNPDQGQSQVLTGQDPAEIDPGDHICPERSIVHSEQVEPGAGNHPGDHRPQERARTRFRAGTGPLRIRGRPVR